MSESAAVSHAEIYVEPVHTANGNGNGASAEEVSYHFEPASIILPPAPEQTLEYENPFASAPANGSGATNGWATQYPVDSRVDTLEANFATPFAPPENLTLQPAAPLALQPIDQTPAANEAAFPADVHEAHAQAMRLDGTEINDIPPSWDEPVDYPILMVQKEETSRAKFLIPLAAVLLIAALGAAYFLVYQPYFANSANKETRAGGAEVQPPVKPAQNDASGQPDSQSPAPQAAATPPSTSTPNPTAAAPSTGAPAATPASAEPASTTQPAATTEGAPAGQGNFSLQAASFPSEAGAKELSEKLIRAGVPAYLASANLAGKGQWYRVRVGRFASSTEAEKYAAQAKQRAKAAGLNLQLVVCDYTK